MHLDTMPLIIMMFVECTSYTSFRKKVQICNGNYLTPHTWNLVGTHALGLTTIVSRVNSNPHVGRTLRPLPDHRGPGRGFCDIFDVMACLLKFKNAMTLCPSSKLNPPKKSWHFEILGTPTSLYFIGISRCITTLNSKLWLQVTTVGINVLHNDKR